MVGQIPSRSALIEQLFASETGENNDVITILGSVKPSRSSKSSFVSILRGLYTKNTKLLQLLNTYRNSIADPEDEVEQFKSFVNEFIIWMDNGGIVLYEKFVACFMDKELELHEHISMYAKPIRNSAAYVKFMSLAKSYIRNPFVMEKLENLSTQFDGIIKKFNDIQLSNNLRTISFSNVAAFPWQSTSTKVASYFVADQIVDRSLNDDFVFENTREHVEIALLNLGNPSAPKSYDAMAILALEHQLAAEESGTRSLLYPPCRFNEVYVELKNDTLVFRPLNFSTDELSISDMRLSLKGNKRLAQEWFSKLVCIFPSERGGCLPVGPDTSCTLSGLGINLHLSSGSESPELAPSPETPSFRDLIESPTLSRSSRDTKEETDKPKPPFIHVSKGPSHLSSSSMSSSHSVESSKQQYDRSLEIIHKTLSGPHDKQDSVMKYVSRSTISPDDERAHGNDRPRSERAEVDYDTPEGGSNDESIDISEIPLADAYLAENIAKFQSAPGISEPSEKQGGVYQLSNGSAIDITNFGRSHQPSFSVAHGLSEISQLMDNLTLDKKKKRKSILGIFKKRNMVESSPLTNTSSPANAGKTSEPILEDEEDHKNIPQVEKPKSVEDSSLSRNVKDLSISTDITRNIDLSEPLSTISEKSDLSGPKSALPSPFALPSSTSTYFFKPYLNGSTASVGLLDLVKEEKVLIPQHLKDVINDDLSIDFYISPSSPKALKVSRWKEKYGKWEMLTTNDTLFLKIVVNYESNKAWLILFKEEYNEEAEDIVDEPLLLLNMDPATTEVRQSSALDAQISAANATTNETIKILLRCSKGSLAHAIFSNLVNIYGVLNSNKNRDLRSQASSNTITSSVMERDTSKSTTLSSVNSMLDTKVSPPKTVPKETSLQTCNSDDITRAYVLTNPENTRMMVVNKMTIRLQKLTEGYERVKFLSSWKILSMYALTVNIISDHFTDANYYHLTLENLEDNDKENFNWLFKEDSKFSIIEKLGKAGLLVKLAPDELYMVECRGKKELKSLIEIF